MGKPLDFLSQCGVSWLTHSRSPIACGAGNGDQNVLLCPLTFTEHFPNLSKIDLELCCTKRERGSIVDNCRIGALAQSD